MASEISDFNLHYIGNYGSHNFLVAGRFYDYMEIENIDLNWAALTCEWYARNGFFEIKDDKYIKNNRVYYKSVDKLVEENPQVLSDMGEFLYQGWLKRKRELEKMRSKEPPVIILPPKEEPPPVEPPAKLPEPEPKKEEPKPKQPSTGVIKFSVWFSIIAAVAGAVSLFVPGAKPIVAVIVTLVKAILSALGA